MSIRNDVSEILYTEEKLQEIVQAMGRRITEDYQGKNLFLVSVLKGSLIFMADLMRAIDLPCAIDFLSVSSYGAGTTTSGEVRIWIPPWRAGTCWWWRISSIPASPCPFC